MQQSRRDHLTSLFAARFGGAPQLWARAPGRVDLMGSHTDYNLGYVLTMAISRDTWIAARGNETRQVNLYAANLDDDDCFPLGAIAKSPGKPWSNYIRGVAAVLASEGLPLRGFDAVIHSNVPLEAGVSSSAALECAAAMVFQAIGGWNLSPERMARLCQRAENQFVGVNCGILDQYSSCLGRAQSALLLDCRDLRTSTVRIAPGISVVICNTMSRRKLSAGEYAARRADCEAGARLLGVGALREATPAMLAARRHELPEQVAKRSEFIVAESARAESLARALEAGDRTRVGALCAESFEGARRLFEICSAAMIAMHEAILAAPGAIGGRQAGAGFGGCLVAFAETEAVEDFRAAVEAAYTAACQTRPEIYAVEAAQGAGLL